MTLELPVFRLGLAGFSVQQEAALALALRNGVPGAMVWEPGALADCDAWFINGARVKWLGDDTIRVAAGAPTARSLQLRLPEIDRPVAFSLPLACHELEPMYSFDERSKSSIDAVLESFESWLAPISAQFSLASHIVEHERALGSGAFEVRLNGALLAVVNMPGEIGVLPTAKPSDFEEAIWSRRDLPALIPENLLRVSLSQLMWQYAVRTQRDVLPKHYRADMLYYRRPPRLPQRALTDSHLLVMRELASAPASFENLRLRCSLDGAQLARDLAALYFVGSITSNPKRATLNQRPMRLDHLAEPSQGQHSSLPSSLDSVPPLPAMRRPPVNSDLTAPAALSLR